MNVRPLLIQLSLYSVLYSNAVLALDTGFYEMSVEKGLSESSSSKRIVELFDSPLSSSVITSEQILRAGVRNIPEALRLVPGVLVREITNGQYDVHIRGLENAPVQSLLTEARNQNTLVMIDDRVVYEYFLGGTFWESLPVSIYDIEKIEVVRGGVSALYGPNAASGIIHIITKRSYEKNTESLSVNAYTGSFNTKGSHIDIKGGGDLFQWRLSGFQEKRGRYENTYFDYSLNEYVDAETLNPLRGIDLNGDTKEASDVSALNLAINNDPASLLAFDFTYSHQSSNAQKTYHSTSQTPLTMNEADSDAYNLSLNFYNWFGRINQNRGSQTTFGFPELDYDYTITQSSLEYQYRAPRLIVRPGIRYDEMTYDGEFIGGERTIRSRSMMLRTEYDPSIKNKLVFSTSLDKYDNPDDTYFSYQISGTHKLNDDYLLRASIQKANRSSFFVNGFLDLDFTLQSDPSQRLIFKGDPNAKLLSFQTYEIGFRVQSGIGQSIDAEIFYTSVTDFNEFIRGVPYSDSSQTVTPSLLQNIDSEVTQTGLTLSWFYQEAFWDINTFITLQTTEVVNQANGVQAPLSYTNEYDKTTPSFYGGLNINWRPKIKWNLNTSLYFMDESEFMVFTPGLTHETSFLTILNASLQHQLTEDIGLSLTAKNLVNHQVSQYYYTDEIKPSLIFGINVDM